MTMTLSSSPTTSTLSPWTKDHTYIIESTRRAHACCKSCEAKIELGRLRVGVVYQHMNGFVCINWHHIECYPDVKQIPVHNLEGFGDLDAVHQKLVQSYMVAGVDTRYLPEARACSA
uniref:PARP-type domain-containing protein n=1 Tax=Globisporangium ultimum (strain ATCC 200006 / CBS 805.95 / DAOM BR144) TaxID=431595 RepID=K3WVA4_GLOUD